MNKLVVVSPHNRRSFIRKKNEVLMSYNTEEPQKHQAKGKGPDAKGHVLYGSIYMKCAEEVHP